MKLETLKIHKTNSGACLVPYLSEAEGSVKKPVAFYIRGKYFPAKVANNLYNRKRQPPILPRKPMNRIMETDFPNGDIPCFVIDRGADIEIIVE